MTNSVPNGTVIGSIIRDGRKRHGLTLRALADDVGLNFTTLSHVEAGRMVVSEDAYRRISERLGLDADELILLSGRIPSWMVAKLLQMTPSEAVHLVANAGRQNAQISALQRLAHHAIPAGNGVQLSDFVRDALDDCYEVGAL